MIVQLIIKNVFPHDLARATTMTQPCEQPKIKVTKEQAALNRHQYREGLEKMYQLSDRRSTRR